MLIPLAPSFTLPTSRLGPATHRTGASPGRPVALDRIPSDPVSFDPGRVTLGARTAPTKPVIHRYLWITLLMVWNTPPLGCTA